jgi:hypothetical protein
MCAHIYICMYECMYVCVYTMRESLYIFDTKVVFFYVEKIFEFFSLKKPL